MKHSVAIQLAVTFLSIVVVTSSASSSAAFADSRPRSSGGDDDGGSDGKAFVLFPQRLRSRRVKATHDEYGVDETSHESFIDGVVGSSDDEQSGGNDGRGDELVSTTNANYTKPYSAKSVKKSKTSKPSSAQPSMNPSISDQPSSIPSEFPSISSNPSSQPSENPSTTGEPSSQPSSKPSSLPSSQPSISGKPSSHPSSHPSSQPSSQPSSFPSLSPLPSVAPSFSPSNVPSTKPSLSPSQSAKPSSSPSESSQPSTSAAPSCLLPSLAIVTSNTPVPIPDQGSASVTLNVGNESDECIIEDVDITVGIDHTFAGDLELSLSSPGGEETAILTDNQGGGSDFVSSNLLTFDDASFQNPNNIGNTNPIQAGTFFSRGDGSGNKKLSGFAGGSPPGDWIFTVTDTFNGCPIGTIDSVTLRITSVCPCELEPSLSPSESTAPSTSTSPSLVPSESTAPSSPPSTSLVPSVVPSVQPSLQPSDVPSTAPSASALPSSPPSTSLVPSPVPSVQPSVSIIPSVVPSISTKPSSSSQPSTCVVEIISPVETLNFEGQQLTFAFTNLEAASDNVQVEVNTRGDLGRLDEFYTITSEGGSVFVGITGNTGTTSDSFDCNTAFNVDTFTITQADFNGYIGGDGTLTIEVNPSPEVNTFCSFDEVFVKLSYISCGLESTAVVTTGVGEEEV